MRNCIGLMVGLALVALRPPGVVLAAEGEGYRPVLRHESSGVEIELPASLRSRIESVDAFMVDRYGTETEEDVVWQPEARLGFVARGQLPELPIGFQLEYEHDLTTGVGSSATEVAGERMPNGRELHDERRKALLRLSLGESFVVGGGYMTSHWGLGMLANDGAHGWTPGSAYFGDPRSGDRVLRVYAGTQPLGPEGMMFRLAFDKVDDDDPLLSGDDATQSIASFRVGVGRPHNAGIYIVFREQDGPRDAIRQRGFDAWVVDVTGSTAHQIDGLGELTLAAELAVITGDTTLGPTPELPEHDMFQVGAVVRASLDAGRWGLVGDFVYASGDQNFDDDEQNAFRIDPNFEVGLLLFRHVLAAQTGRAVVTAADPGIVGRPVPDLERIPTGGSPSNTIAFFPRAWWRPQKGFEVYGGPLFAWSDVAYADPFNTRVDGGGRARNALAGDPGGFYGVELDVGARYRRLLHSAQLTVGAELGALFPGGAFDDIAGDTMNEIIGGRFMVDLRF